MELRHRPGLRSGPLAVGPWASHIPSLASVPPRRALPSQRHRGEGSLAHRQGPLRSAIRPSVLPWGMPGAVGSLSLITASPTPDPRRDWRAC